MGPGGLQSFFAVAAKRVKQKYDKGTFCVAKSGLSILYNLEFLNLKSSRRKEEERRRERVSKTKKGQSTFEECYVLLYKKKSPSRVSGNQFVFS